MNHRKEIDGLRALAIMPVILFHVGSNTFSGGYIGVDVFFVISGYLIASIIIKELSDNSFSILKFYERRARRILPALSLVMFASLIAAWIYLSPADYKSFSESLVAVSTFTSNIYFYLVSGYFETGADEKPLLHTWSLAIEEQFYVVFPLLLVVLWTLGRRSLVVLFALLAVGSLLLAQYLSREHPNAAFYFVFSRAWELMAGVLLAFAPQVSSGERLISAAACWLGLLIIIYAVFAFDAYTPFPGLYALAPVLGAALIIGFGRADNIVTYFLRSGPMVFVGLISYSLYLWHFPILAFLRVKTVGSPNTQVVFLTIATVFLLSYLSWKYVEEPFRNKKTVTKKQAWAFSSVSVVFFLASGLAGYLLNGIDSRFEYSDLSRTATSTPMRSNCHTSGKNYLSPEVACRYYRENVTWATLGDSHVAELSQALAERLRDHNQGLLHLSFSDCPPAYNFQISESGCTDWLQDSVAYLVNDDDIKNVLVGFRHVYYLYGNHSHMYPEIPDSDPRRIMRGQFKGTRTDAEAVYWHGFKSIIDTLLIAGKRVFVMFPIPEVPLNIHRGIHPFSIFDDRPLLDLEKTLPMTYYKQRNASILPKLNALKFNSGLIAINPIDILCDEVYCRAVINDETMYFDDDHLSVSGARRVTALLEPYF